MIVFYDLDGTLIDSKREIVMTLNESLVRCHIDPKDKIEEFKIGPHLVDLIPDAFPKGYFTKEKLEEVISVYRSIYNHSDHKMTRPYEGIDEMILLAPYQQYLLTNKPMGPASKILANFNWLSRFEAIWPSDSSTGETKITLLKKAKTMFSRSIFMVGDTAPDIVAARTNGIYSIGVLYGEGTKEELVCAGANLLVSSPSELRERLMAFWREESRD